jgi:hypothetical protein
MLNKIIFIAGCLLTGTNAYTQDNDNYVDLDMYVSSSSTFNSAELLENAITVPNALRLRVETEDDHGFIYAAIPTGIKTYNNQTIPTSLISLKLNNTNCNSGQQRQVIRTEIPMSTTPQLLFQQGRKSNYTADWYYDVILDPIGYGYAPGTYNFTLQFTMTQP